jgi:hypothetical protein
MTIKIELSRLQLSVILISLEWDSRNILATMNGINTDRCYRLI